MFYINTIKELKREIGKLQDNNFVLKRALMEPKYLKKLQANFNQNPSQVTGMVENIFDWSAFEVLCRDNTVEDYIKFNKDYKKQNKKIK